jgi:hypothetical protein
MDSNENELLRATLTAEDQPLTEPAGVSADEGWGPQPAGSAVGWETVAGVAEENDDATLGRPEAKSLNENNIVK